MAADAATWRMRLSTSRWRKEAKAKAEKAAAEKAADDLKSKAAVALLNANPQQADKDGRLPLHNACRMTHTNVELVEALLKAFSQAADIHGWLPHHSLV